MLCWRFLIHAAVLGFHRRKEFRPVDAYGGLVLRRKETTEEKHDRPPYCSCSVIQGAVPFLIFTPTRSFAPHLLAFGTESQRVAVEIYPNETGPAVISSLQCADVFSPEI